MAIMTSALLENGIDHIRGVFTDVMRWCKITSTCRFAKCREVCRGVQFQILHHLNALNYMRVFSSVRVEEAP